MNSQLGDILHQQEIKQIIAKLNQINIKDYGSTAWLKQDQNLQKLNMQLHVNAIMKNDQYILQECVVQDKFKILIYDLIMTTVWKTKVLPKIKEDVKQMNSMKIYLAIYHQAVLCNILQVLMFHRTAIDQSGDFLIEIIDYCYQKIAYQIQKVLKRKKQQRQKCKNNKEQQLNQQQKKKKRIEQVLKRTPAQQLDRQIEDIQFSLFMMALSIIRYITDYVQHLQIGILHHLIVQCNLFALLVPLIEERPWLRTNQKGQRQIFQNNKWTVVPKSQLGRLPKIEAQVWITLFNLLMDPQVRKKYQLNDERKNMLLRLRKYMNQVLLDQIPNLSAMLRSLEQLSLMNVPSQLSQNPFMVQQVPQIKLAIQKDQNWPQLIEQHRKRMHQSIDQTERTHMQRLADLYSNNNVEGLLQGFKCGKCKKQAFKRCSKCKGIWYCSKQCQVSDWPNHKANCSAKVKAAKQAEQQRLKAVEQGLSVNNTKPKVLIDQLD